MLNKKLIFAVLIALGVAVTVGVLLRSDSPESATKAGGSTAAQSDAPSESVPVALGVMQTLGDLEVTVYGVREVPSPRFIPPNGGSKWVIADVGVRNTGSSSFSLITEEDTALQDASGQNFLPTSAATAGSTGLDSTIKSNDLLRGEVGFEVPAVSVGVIFVFKSTPGSDARSATGSDELTWLLR